MNYTFFFHLTSPFSNFHPSLIKYKEYVFISNEQFFMFSKAKVFNDEETANKILDLNNNELAKKFLNKQITRQEIISDKNLTTQWNDLMKKIKSLGREVKNYDDALWSEKRVKNMIFGARLKFNQNEDLKQILLSTGNTQMIESNPYDKIWSCGLLENDAKKTEESKWPGLNLLGKSLDKIKEEIVLEIKSKTTIKQIEVVNFYQVGKTIPEDGVYIGRANKSFNLKGSIFNNPFPMKDQSDNERQRVVDEFKDWLWEQLAQNKITKKELLELNGKKLVCYCFPKLCHGNILKETVELLINNQQNFDSIVIKYQKAKKINP